MMHRTATSIFVAPPIQRFAALAEPMLETVSTTK